MHWFTTLIGGQLGVHRDNFSLVANNSDTFLILILSTNTEFQLSYKDNQEFFFPTE